MATSEKPKSALSVPQKALRKLGLDRDIDLALHLPLRYEDETRLNSLSTAREGECVQFLAEVKSLEIVFKPRRQLVVQVHEFSPSAQPTLTGDGLIWGEICTLRFFNFYPNLQKTLAVGQRIRLRGEVKGAMLGKTIMHPTVYSAQTPLPSTLTPIYPTTAGLPQAYIKRAVLTGLERCVRLGYFNETIPAVFLKPGLWPLAKAVQYLHEPQADVSILDLEDKSHPAWQRLKAEELLAQQLSQLRAKRERLELKAPRLGGEAAENPSNRAPAIGERVGADSLLDKSLKKKGNFAASNHVFKAPCSTTNQLLQILPFKLTSAQLRVVQEISSDIKKDIPMYRLLQGDVGSGKTVVAALAATQCIDSGYQCVLMAPTEILAEQHFKKLIGWLAPLLEQRQQCVAWLSGSQKKKERQAMLDVTSSGQAALVVGTHAVIQEQVKFKSLGLVLIDEQHRFGVAQRVALKDKLPDQEPHLLMMSATPIPRTLAMSYYADLDVSTIDELPPGRTPVITKVVSDHRREEVISRIQAQLHLGRQVYWVCPLIQESEAIDLTNATQTHELLSKSLPGEVIGLLHSKMPSVEKKEVMQTFTEGKMGVLVSTTVIEVGVDVPNASLMVIEHAERFGLSQLHQLRGRVGRGAAASACVLMYSSGERGKLSETARERLKAMADTQDGFEIARKDLEIRGPGEFLGARQSGTAMLRFADLNTDQEWLEWARALAPLLLDSHPLLAEKHVSRWLGNKQEYLKA
jgi:ATP-dependent DNA helicase RecG